MSEAPVLLQERKSDVLWLTLNRPAQANAMDTRMHESLVNALAAAGGDETVRALVLTAAGERVFSAGADLKEMAGLSAEQAALHEPGSVRLLRTLCAVLDFPKPLICAVQGKAIGAGCMLALVADELIAAESGSFSCPEIALGMPSPMGAAVIAARGPIGLVRRMVQEGTSVSAQEALNLGLVDALAPSAELADNALERARTLAQRTGPAFSGNKQWINRSLRAQLVEAAQAAERLRRERANA